MNAPDQGLAQGDMHGAVALDSGLALKGGGADGDVKVALAALAVAAVAPVTFAIIDHIEVAGGKGGLKPGPDFFSNTHFIADTANKSPPSLLSFVTYITLLFPSRKGNCQGINYE